MLILLWLVFIIERFVLIHISLLFYFLSSIVNEDPTYIRYGRSYSRISWSSKLMSTYKISTLPSCNYKWKIIINYTYFIIVFLFFLLASFRRLWLYIPKSKFSFIGWLFYTLYVYCINSTSIFNKIPYTVFWNPTSKNHDNLMSWPRETLLLVLYLFYYDFNENHIKIPVHVYKNLSKFYYYHQWTYYLITR